MSPTTKLNDALTTATTILNLAPGIIQLIVMVEGLFSGLAKSGPAKKSIVLSTIPATLQNEASDFIDLTVGQLNAANKNKAN